ncbi:MAG TPA: ionic transporter y4hA, partial [Flavobacteriaceae bacterium]|nr:ionic transporter y4hA [Flavobacteriaceae bacterium]
MHVDNFLSKKFNLALPYWTIICPILAIFSLTIAEGFKDQMWFSGVLGIILISAVLSAVHHAEVVAHKVGEPFGTIILALAI